MDKKKIIAVCGIDGAGKTTLISKLHEDLGDERFYFPVKRVHTNAELLYKYMSYDRTYDDCPYNRVDAYGSALDFLEHYEKNISPLIQKDKIVICDRYKLCYLAYAYQVNSTFIDISKLLESVIDPDYYIFINTDIEVAKKRLLARNEDIFHIEGFEAAYLEIIKGLNNVICIPSNDEFGSTYNIFKNTVLDILNDR